MVGERELGRGSGTSKKASEQAAAREALAALDRRSSRDVPEEHPHPRFQVVPQDSSCASTRASRSSSAPTAAASRTSPTRCSGRWRRSRRPSCAPPPARTCCSRGSDSRPPAGVCEVELVLDNSCGTLAARVRRGVGHAPPAPRERGRVLHQPRPGAPARRARAAGRHRPGTRDALGHRAGQGGGDPALQAARAPPLRRGGRRPRQVPAPPHAAPRPRWCGSRPSWSAPATWSARCSARLRPLAMQATAAERAAKLAGEIAVGRVTLLSLRDGRRAARRQWAPDAARGRRR